jgi:dienelactone hydrolase
LRNSLLVTLILLSALARARAQKQLLDFSSPTGWPTIRSTEVSNDGKYAKYSITIPDKENRLFLEATDLSWKKEISGRIDGVFTNDSRRFVFSASGDTLGICQLGTANLNFISNVNDYAMPAEGDGRFLAYQKSDSSQTLVLMDFVSGRTKQYPHTNFYRFDKSGRFLLICIAATKDSVPKDNALLLDMVTDSASTLCHHCRPSQFSFDAEGSGVSFFSKGDSIDPKVISLRYFKTGMDSARIIVGSNTAGMSGVVMSDQKLYFSWSGDRLFFSIGKASARTAALDSPINQRSEVRIMGPHDAELEYANSQDPFIATVDLKAIQKGVTRLQSESEKGRSFTVDYSGKWCATVSNIVGDPIDIKNIAARPDLYLVSTADGSRRLLKKRLIFSYWQFSPSGKYLIWFDNQQKQWFSYNIALNQTKNISGCIGRPISLESDRPELAAVHDIVGWLENDKGVLIYDRYDIWQVDLAGLNAPFNLTHGYGAAHKIKFKYLDFHLDQPAIIGLADTLLLSAFDIKSKQDGFFRLSMRSGKLDCLIMSAHIYTFQHEDFCGAASPGQVIKAENANVYLVPRMSATEYPNWYVTTDLKQFKPITNLAPQKEYNWYTTELIHWNMPAAKTGEGILFKPENFDPAVKYPIIFYYYEKNAFDLNIFIHPALSDGTLPIPWFVSHGYLVFVPDINYELGHPGRSACRAVTSAALYLSKKPWVDSKKMGLQGHSFGGSETNYIISHSSLFVAAAPASALCDDISSYSGSDISPLYFERWQGRIGATPWQRRDLYLNDSPIFNADKVRCNVLIMHGADDTHVPYAQGLQWYYALRRLGKEVWMLSYQGEGHILTQPENQLDYSARLGQFFCHFLKEEPAPKWMSSGFIPGMGAFNYGLAFNLNMRFPD